jgi:CBS-domain-containing membrane protein
VGRRELTGQQITLEDVMRPAISVRHDALAQEAWQVMLDNNVPVVNARGYLIGFVNGGHLLASTLPLQSHCKLQARLWTRGGLAILTGLYSELRT